MNIQITNSSAGHFEFNTTGNSDTSFVLSQMSNIGYYFEKFLVEERFDTVIEIGTYKGGLAILLDVIKQKHNLNFELHTLDISIWNETEFSKVLTAFAVRGVIFKKLDVFSQDGDSYIKSLVQDVTKKVCVLCDGGNKINEFNHFSNIIKQGDFIMAHDYEHNSEGIDDLSYECSWGWKEIKYSDIAEAVKRNNLQMNLDVRFPEVAWACYKKV